MAGDGIGSMVCMAGDGIGSMGRHGARGGGEASAAWAACAAWGRSRHSNRVSLHIHARVGGGVALQVQRI
eukprot:352130-Chlamydomonas_euryale.AAC.6